jgi:hypothetical protein
MCLTIWCGFTYKVVGLTSSTSQQPVVYRGVDAGEQFVECMVKEQEDIKQRFRQCEPMKVSGDPVTVVASEVKKTKGIRPVNW